MSYSAFVSTSNARIRSSRENRRDERRAARSRSLSAAISGSATRDGSTDRTSRSRVSRASSRTTSAQVVARLDRARRRARTTRGASSSRDRVGDVEQQVAADQPEHGRHVVGGDRSRRRRRSPDRARSARRACCRRRRARSACSAASSTAISSASAIVRSWSAICLTPIVFSSKTCERDWIVAGTFSSSVVAIMKTTCGGGSSIDFSSASNDWAESRCTSSMMKIL